jgi:hypothetical protein
MIGRLIFEYCKLKPLKVIKNQNETTIQLFLVKIILPLTAFFLSPDYPLNC